MSSFRNRTTLSAEWVARYYQRETAVTFLEDVVGFMLSILEDQDQEEEVYPFDTTIP